MSMSSSPPTEHVLDQALALAALGLRVVPIKPNGVIPELETSRERHPANPSSRLVTLLKSGSTTSEPGDACHVPGSDTAGLERCDG